MASSTVSPRYNISYSLVLQGLLCLPNLEPSCYLGTRWLGYVIAKPRVTHSLTLLGCASRYDYTLLVHYLKQPRTMRNLAQYDAIR